jgi:hypothetical protein
VAPMSSLSGVELLGFWEFGMGGLIGWREEQIGSVYKQPDKREDGSCHSWRAPSKWKGVQRERRGGNKGGRRVGEKAKEEPRRVYMPP